MNIQNTSEFQLQEIIDSDIIDTNSFDNDELLSEYNSSKKAICLIGQVQSGKTKAMKEIIDKAFKKYNFDFIIMLGGTMEILLNQTIERFESSFIHNVSTNFSEIEFESQRLFIIMKTETRLKEMNRFIEWNHGKRILIIDDECDYASVNTKKDGYSSISKLIKESYEKIGNGGLLSVSATPYSNISKGESEFVIDNIYCLPTNKEYMGLSFFNSLDNFYISVDKFHHIMRNDYLKLEFSFYLFLINSYRLYYQEGIKKSDMLVYESLKHEDNRRIKKDLEKIIRNIQTKKVSEYLDFFKINLDPNQIINFYKRNRPELFLLIGSEDSDTELFSKSESNYKVIIGGYFLSRGFTYKNLTTELITYSGEIINADTVLQRCRWFGYRGVRSNYMNVITSDKLINSFNAIQKINDYLFKNKQGCKFNVSHLKEKLEEWEDKNADIVRMTSNAKHGK